jgi:hypothetical protein
MDCAVRRALWLLLVLLMVVLLARVAAAALLGLCAGRCWWYCKSHGSWALALLRLLTPRGNPGSCDAAPSAPFLLQQTACCAAATASSSNSSSSNSGSGECLLGLRQLAAAHGVITIDAFTCGGEEQQRYDQVECLLLAPSSHSSSSASNSSSSSNGFGTATPGPALPLPPLPQQQSKQLQQQLHKMLSMVADGEEEAAEQELSGHEEAAAAGDGQAQQAQQAYLSTIAESRSCSEATEPEADSAEADDAGADSVCRGRGRGAGSNSSGCHHRECYLLPICLPA